MISHYASLIGISSQDYWQQVKELRMPRPKRRDEHELAFTIIASKLSHLQEQQRHRSCQREQERTNVPTLYPHHHPRLEHQIMMVMLLVV
jgi:hypothetical protein